MNAIEQTVSRLSQLIASYRFDLSDEKRLQVQLEEALESEEFDSEREYRLSPQDIPDFLLDGNIAVECKLKGHRKMAIYRQLKRYAEHENIKALVLITNVSMGLPETIEDKPVYYLSLSRAWL